MTKVLIIDDSALMRRALRQALEAVDGFEVACARDGEDGLKRIHEFDPDVVTLDINMPVMDGLTCLSRIMVECPKPVVMVSSLTNAGALATLEALELGAVDYICKPGGTVSLNMHEVFGDLIEKLHVACGARIRRTRGLAKRISAQNNGGFSTVIPGSRKSSPASPARPKFKKTAPAPSFSTDDWGQFDAANGPVQGAVLVGVSTGGPRTLEEILPYLPAGFPLPVLICQHMPRGFTGALAGRLQNSCALHVTEVVNPMPLEPGKIYIGQGDADLVISKRGTRLFAVPMPADPEQLWHPCADLLVKSAMTHFRPADLIAVELTGMGYDGAATMAELHRNGGHTIAESEESAIVFGMPQELITRGGATEVLHCTAIADAIIRAAEKIARPARMSHAVQAWGN